MAGLPPPAGVQTGYYHSDDEYTRDALRLASAGWFVSDVRRAPDGTIIASYTAHSALSPVPTHASELHGISGWLARQHIAVRIGLMVGILVVTLIFASVVSALGGGSHDRTMARSAPTAVPTAIPTVIPTATTPSIPTPTAVPAPDPVNGPYVGGTMDSFTRAFGPSDSPGSWQTVTIQGASVSLDVAETQAGDSLDGQPRAVVIDVTPATPGATWTMGEATSIAKSFLPPDALHTRDLQVQAGTDHQYTSMALTGSLAPSAFLYSNNSSIQAPDGSLDWICHATSSGGVDFCETGAGISGA